VCPQRPDRTNAYGLLKLQPRRSVQKRRLFAAFWDYFGKQVNHAVIRSIDTAGYIRATQDARFHLIVAAKNIKALPGRYDAVRQTHDIVRVVDTLDVALA